MLGMASGIDPEIKWMERLSQDSILYQNQARLGGWSSSFYNVCEKKPSSLLPVIYCLDFLSMSVSRRTSRQGSASLRDHWYPGRSPRLLYPRTRLMRGHQDHVLGRTREIQDLESQNTFQLNSRTADSSQPSAVPQSQHSLTYLV